MIYLAEVQTAKNGFRGIAKSELKLLALQRSAKSWTPVPGEDAINLEQSYNFNLGLLIIVQLNAHRQVQDIQLATHQLPYILPKLSHQLETFPNQAEEIKLWQESLHYQSEEMNRYKMDEAQLQEIDVLREETEQLRQEIQHRREELEIAQENLRREQQVLAAEQQRWQSIEQQKIGAEKQKIEKDWEDLRYEKLCIEELQQEIYAEQELSATNISNTAK